MAASAAVMTVLFTVVTVTGSTPAMPTNPALPSPLPPMWGEAITLDKLPRAAGAGSPVIIQPWDYLQRLGALKSLVELTQAHMPCLYQGNVEENILVRFVNTRM